MKNHISNKLVKLTSIMLVVIITLGCEEDKGPITSDTMTIVVNSLNQSDINDQGIIEKDENISNGTGNPWGEFIKDAEAECGNNPDHFEVTSVTVQIADHDGVDVFEDVIQGNAYVYFMSTQGSDVDAIRVNIGSSSNLKGTSANELINLASSSELNVLRERLLGGDFHVGFNGQTNLTKNDAFSIDVIVKFVVRAYCN